jgi:hypothetical protein
MPTNFAHLFTHEDMQDCLMHWAGCPAHGYLGQDGGGLDLLRCVVTQQHAMELEQQVLKTVDAEVPLLRGYFVKVAWVPGADHMAFFTEDGRCVDLTL